MSFVTVTVPLSPDVHRPAPVRSSVAVYRLCVRACVRARDSAETRPGVSVCRSVSVNRLRVSSVRVRCVGLPLDDTAPPLPAWCDASPTGAVAARGPARPSGSWSADRCGQWVDPVPPFSQGTTEECRQWHPAWWRRVLTVGVDVYGDGCDAVAGICRCRVSCGRCASAKIRRSRS